MEAVKQNLTPPSAAKPPKAAKEPKAPKEPKVPKVSRFATLYPDSAPLAITTAEGKNPKKAGSKAFEHFELYRGCKTVGEAKAKGANYNAMAWDVARQLIKIG